MQKKTKTKILKLLQLKYTFKLLIQEIDKSSLIYLIGTLLDGTLHAYIQNPKCKYQYL